MAAFYEIEKQVLFLRVPAQFEANLDRTTINTLRRLSSRRPRVRAALIPCRLDGSWPNQ